MPEQKNSPADTQIMQVIVIGLSL